MTTEFNLPELKGTPKQIAWAEKIRKEVWEELVWGANEQNLMRRSFGMRHFGKNAIKDLDGPNWRTLPWVSELFSNTSASFWIENRDARLMK